MAVDVEVPLCLFLSEKGAPKSTPQGEQGSRWTDRGSRKMKKAPMSYVSELGTGVGGEQRGGRGGEHV